MLGLRVPLVCRRLVVIWCPELYILTLVLKGSWELVIRVINKVTILLIAYSPDL